MRVMILSIDPSNNDMMNGMIKKDVPSNSVPGIEVIIEKVEKKIVIVILVTFIFLLKL